MTSAADAVYDSLHRQSIGELLRPADPGYTDARTVWNGMIARNPGLIVRCATVEEVRAAIRSAQSANALTAIRCGGHSLAGHSTCDDGVVIDLSPMRSVAVNPETRRARFSGGCLLGDVDRATQAAGLVFPAGVVSQTGAAGLVLGGGYGWLTREFGMSCDNVESFTLVLADGSVVRASEKENGELFWALRGGGGNFGVVTEFEVKLHPLSSVLFGTAMCLGDDMTNVLQYWRDFMPQAPDKLKWSFSLRLAPDSENIPAEVRGAQVASQAVLWIGDPEDGRSNIEQALSVCNPVAITKNVFPFVELQTMADWEFPVGYRYYTKSGYMRTLSDEAIACMINALATIPSPLTQIEVGYQGGAAARVGSDETAFGDRSAPFIINILGTWVDAKDDEANVSWIRNLFAELKPFMTPGVYVNFMSGDEDNRVTEAYRQRWERLVSVKSHYDPDNFFRLNPNIPPRKASAAETR
jgi:FAD binding domain/Berberine and berberine like